jgi:membrane protease YdiL (CAAX protease family)
MHKETEHLVGFRRFVSRFKIAKLIVFSAPLFAILVASQLLMQGGAHAVPLSARPFWWLASKSLYAAAMLWLYSLQVRYFERRPISELAPRDAAPRVTGGIVVGFALFSSVLAVLYLGGLEHVQFGGLAGLTTQASASLGAAVGEELLFRGAIFRITEEWLGTTAALIVSAVLFGAAHGLNSGATVIGVIAIGLEAGVLLGIAYSASRSLWLPIGMHAAMAASIGSLITTTLLRARSHDRPKIRIWPMICIECSSPWNALERRFCSISMAH